MTILVGIENDEVNGTISYETNEHNEGHLRGMAVRPSKQGQGLAEALLRQAETDLQALGCQRVTLDTTRPLERAISFYEKRGYKSTGESTDFFGMELITYQKLVSATDSATPHD